MSNKIESNNDVIFLVLSNIGIHAASLDKSKAESFKDKKQEELDAAGYKSIVHIRQIELV